MDAEGWRGDEQGCDGKDEEMNLLLGIQARSKSSRFEGKYKALVGGVPMLKRICDTCLSVSVYPRVNTLKTIVLIPEGDDEIFDFCQSENMELFVGSEEDLVDRYWSTIKTLEYDAVVRITGDCPLIPRSIIEDVVKGLMECDYVTNVNPRTYPDGYDCQGISAKGLEWVNENQKGNREHPFLELDTDPVMLTKFQAAGFTVCRIINPQKIIMNPHHPENKLSVDTKEDLERLNAMLRGKK